MTHIFFTQSEYCTDAMFKAKVVRIFCVVCPCLFALLLNCSALNSGKEQKRPISRRCMVNCFHSGVETFRRTLADKVKNNGAVHDGCSLAITKVNASKYNGIHNQMQTPYYSETCSKRSPSGNAVVSAYNTGCPPNTGFDRLRHKRCQMPFK